MISEPHKITVNLDNSRHANSFRDGESLWESELDRMFRLLLKHFDSLEHQDKQTMMGNKHRGHAFSAGRTQAKEDSSLSIGLFGTYGSGKSSLLRTFVDRVNNMESDLYHKDEFKGLRHHLYSLPVIEPDVRTDSDQFLYEFLARALAAEREFEERRHSSFGGTPVLSSVQQKFQEVSEFLQAIDKESTIGSDFDPLGISLERLDRHTSRIHLTEAIRTFLDALCNSLTSQSGLIILPVDDADMSFGSLVSTLDTLRRYLRHARLVPVFSFTGRLAEESLHNHFENKLSRMGQNNNENDRLVEANTGLSITENLAIQYLGKLFPVRNRIKLGYASARLQTVRFLTDHARKKREKLEKDFKGFPVLEILKTGSLILFGHTDSKNSSEVRSPLQSATLRRQLQIIDVMQEARVFDYNPKSLKEEQDLTMSWAEVYEKATWSLLNVHRDVLRELDLDIEDLYSWTPKGLRDVVLTTILGMSLERRQMLIKQWRYRTEDRRSMLLSLLVANIYRPRMFQEEPSGDNHAQIEAHAEKVHTAEDIDFKGKGKSKEVQQTDKEQRYYMQSFSLRKACVWFLNIWIGFYLPVVLFRNTVRIRNSEEPENTSGKKNNAEDMKNLRARGVGWGLHDGPIHAIRELLHFKTDLATGMMFLDPKEFSLKVDLLTQYINRDDEFQSQYRPKLEPEAKERDGGEYTQDEDFFARKKEWINFEELGKKVVDAFPNAPGNNDSGFWGMPDFSETEPPGNDSGPDKTPVRILDSLHEIDKCYTYEDSWVCLIPDLWCFYGYHEGEPWAAVSLWRGLSLAGRIIEHDVHFRARNKNLLEKAKLGKEACTKKEQADFGRIQTEKLHTILQILYNHIRTSKVMGDPEKVTDDSGNIKTGEKHRFGRWRFNDRIFQKNLRRLAKAIFSWLDHFPAHANRIEPMTPFIERNERTNIYTWEDGINPGFFDEGHEDHIKQRRDDLDIHRNKWKACFVRRMHGDNLISYLWQGLEYPDEHEFSPSWTAFEAMEKWCNELMRFFDCGKEEDQEDNLTGLNKTRTMLMTCPFILPFTRGERQKEWPEHEVYRDIRDRFKGLILKENVSKDDLKSARDKMVEDLGKSQDKGAADKKKEYLTDSRDGRTWIDEFLTELDELEKGNLEDKTYDKLPGLDRKDQIRIIFYKAVFKLGNGGKAFRFFRFTEAERMRQAAGLLRMRRRWSPGSAGENTNIETETGEDT